MKMQSIYQQLEELHQQITQDPDWRVAWQDLHTILQETLVLYVHTHCDTNLTDDSSSVKLPKPINDIKQSVYGEKDVSGTDKNSADVSMAELSSNCDHQNSIHDTIGQTYSDAVGGHNTNDSDTFGSLITKDRSSSLRKEVLLMLTCLKTMFDNQFLVEEKMETLRVRIIPKELDQCNILSVMVTLVGTDDMFISYSALKTLVSALKCRNLPEKDVTLQCIIDLSSRSHTKNSSVYLDLLILLMANRSGQQTNSWCFQNLKSTHLLKPEILTRVLDSDMCFGDQMSLLTLLQKIVKFINKCEEETRQSYLENVFLPLHDHLLTILTTNLSNVNLTTSRLLCRNVLHIYNTLLDYGGQLAKLKAVKGHYSHLTLKILTEISPTLLQTVPQIKQSVWFGGTVRAAEKEREQEEAEKSTNKDVNVLQSGDFVLLRRLLLVIFKSCAIIAKSDLSQFEDKALECVQGTIDLVTKRRSSEVDEWLPLVFSEQDDSWIEVLLCLLDVHIHAHRLLPPDMSCHTNPHKLFLQFMAANSCDHVVLVDLLTSPETCFLLYFLRYLKCAAAEWERFVDACIRRFHQNSETSLCDFGDGKDRVNIVMTPCKNHDDVSDISELCQDKSSETILLSPDPVDPDLASRSTPIPEGHFSKSPKMLNLTAYSDSESSDEDFEEAEKYPSPGMSMKCDTADSYTEELTNSKMSSVAGVSTICDRSCDLQCMEPVMSAVIRVRLRIERLCEQDLFLYNPKSLIGVIENCEALYDQTANQS